MKRLISIVLACLIICMCVCACGNNEQETNVVDTDSEKIVEQVSSVAAVESTSDIVEDEVSETNIQESDASQEESMVPDWNTEDPEQMLKQMRESSEFQTWREIFKFVPQYNSENADELLADIISSIQFYNFMEYFPGYSRSDSQFLQDDVAWYIKNIFNVSDPAWEHARAIWNNLSYADSAVSEKYFHHVIAGAPGVGFIIEIESAELCDNGWEITIHTTGEDETDDRSGSYSTVIMQRNTVNQNEVWTMCSRSDEPYYEYENGILTQEYYSWNTNQTSTEIQNELIDLPLPEGLTYSYQNVYDKDGINKSRINFGKEFDTEISLLVIADANIEDVDGAVDYCLDQIEQDNDGRQYNVTVEEPVVAADMEYQHIRYEDSHDNMDYYVTLYKNNEGQNRLVIWKCTEYSYGDWISWEDINELKVPDEIIWK